jgi:hypothetical protein
VVSGEPQRAFYGNQFGLIFPLFVHYGIPLWVPEVGGAIDPDNEAHDLIMVVFGGMSKGERNRIKFRVWTAMAAQAQLEGRFLGAVVSGQALTPPASPNRRTHWDRACRPCYYPSAGDMPGSSPRTRSAGSTWRPRAILRML